MSTINVGDFPIDPYVVDGVELAGRLNRLKLAIYSGLSNTTRPTDITAGGTWVKFTAPSTYTLMVFNGTVDTAVAVGDVTSGALALPFNTATNYKTGDLIWDVATGTLQSAKHAIASGSAYNAGDWNPNQVLANNVLNLAGGTMTGPITLAGNATGPLQPMTLQQGDYPNISSKWNKGQSGDIQALPATTGTVTLDLTDSNNWGGTLTGNITLANPTGIASSVGQCGVITLTQGATPFTIAFGTFFKPADGVTMPALTAAASAKDLLVYYVESATRITIGKLGGAT